jgi:ABC-type glycerol-3-phosphate transport system substrate-binding protein
MKKSILLVGCLILLAVGVVSVSCSKDDDWKGCRCTLDGETITITAEEAKAEGYNSCAEIAEDYEASCTNL